MRYWFIVHDLLAYSQHSDMIGNVVKAPGLKQPKFHSFCEIQKGDIVVYYATKDYVIPGIFEITTDMEYLDNDEHWKEIMVYRITPIVTPPPGKYLSLKKLIKDPKVTFDMFPNKKKWGGPLQGKTCTLLTEKDYLVIKNAMSNPAYLKNINEIKVTSTKWHEEHGKKDSIKQGKVSRHQEAVLKWKDEEEKKFGLFKPDIKTNTVDLNEILPKSVC